MTKFERVVSDLNNIEDKIQDNCKRSMTPFKGRNMKARLDKIYRDANKLKDPEQTSAQAKVKELKKSVRAMVEAHELSKSTQHECGCKKCNPASTRARKSIRL